MPTSSLILPALQFSMLTMYLNIFKILMSNWKKYCFLKGWLQLLNKTAIVAETQAEEVKKMSQTGELVLKIEGMSCGHCKMSVENALKAIPGVTSASVNLEKKEAIITGSAEREALVKAVEDVGFDVV